MKKKMNEAQKLYLALGADVCAYGIQGSGVNKTATKKGPGRKHVDGYSRKHDLSGAISK